MRHVPLPSYRKVKPPVGLFCLPATVRMLASLDACLLSEPCKDLLHLLGVREINLNL